MAKVYFTKPEISQYQGLSEMLINLVEEGIERREKQRSFQSLYDIEVVSVTIYYRKNWHYNDLSQEGNEKGKGG